MSGLDGLFSAVGTVDAPGVVVSLKDMDSYVCGLRFVNNVSIW